MPTLLKSHQMENDKWFYLITEIGSCIPLLTPAKKCWIPQETRISQKGQRRVANSKYCRTHIHEKTS